MQTENIRRQRALTLKTRRKPLPAPPPRVENIEEWVQRARDLPDVRFDKIKAIREALADGSYNVEDRLDAMLARFSESLPRPQSAETDE
jgi:hypothetical protein